MPDDAALEGRIIAEVWRGLGGTPGAERRVQLAGPRCVLPSPFEVTALAAASIGLAALAAAELLAARRGEDVPRVRVDRAHAAAAFRREALATPVGWRLPPPWDAIAGDYRARDGWIRLHTNYAWHREAALRVLDAPAERDAVTRAVAGRAAEELEKAVVDAGGCAAAMRDPAAWRAHAQGGAVGGEPVLAWSTLPCPAVALPPSAHPLDGVRVLDLTRVIAGPVCTSFLAAWGADVLRLDPPGFAEVPAILPETSAGKRRASLDLRDADGRARFAALLREAHVLVAGYRPDVLARLGYDDEVLRELNPSLVVVALDAYGWSGPWSKRRGFDSLVQMSSGIAQRGGEVYTAGRPVPLPAQALDHATGYLLAAGTCRALVELRAGRSARVRASLARTAALLLDLGEGGEPLLPLPSPAEVDPWLETVSTGWGPMRRVRVAGAIEGLAPLPGPPPGPLGSDPPTW